jgi:hypothetical protein
MIFSISGASKRAFAGPPFPARQKGDFFVVFDFFPTRYPLTLGNSGSVLARPQEGCRFLGSYGVSWFDLLPMRCFCVKIDDSFAIGFRSTFA